MADEESSNDIKVKITDVYIPFLKKLLDHLEKKKDQPATKVSYEKLSYVYQIFTEGDDKEKLDVYAACKGMLEKWYNRYKDCRTKQGDKKAQDGMDAMSEDSQSETSPSAKKAENKSDSTVPISIVSVRSCAGNAANFAERQDGVYLQDEAQAEPKSMVPSIPIANIKKEKVDSTPTTKATPEPSKPTKPVQAVSALPVTPAAPAAQEEEEDNGSKEIMFICASCQFRTTDEVDFMKHARTDHRTDLSLWCKRCGKCFSNAGVLVTHIKEANCQKEEMIYRCGVKDCSFETPSGQTFVHHLRHCHKGSPFIFCVHCQKIFTLPHCLILHMQNECPFKDKNRRSPGQSVPAETTPSAATPVSKTVTTPTPSAPAKQTPARQPNATIPAKSPVVSKPAAVHTPITPSPRGRGRASTRGRWSRSSRSSRYSESSDSDDPDDPSWKPEELLNSQPLRRSARWAKRVSEAKDPEIEESGALVTKKSKGIIEEPVKQIISCPCCDFSAAFQSLLRDHYVASHKHEKKMACMVCNVKFENLDLFISHFSLHEKAKEQSQNEEAENEDKTNSNEHSNSTTVSESGNGEVASPEKTSEPSRGDFKDIPLESVPGKFPAANQDKNVIQIPYQTAIHERLQKDCKIKSFEDLKSVADLEKMQSEPKLKHFYKCTVYNCTYTTDDKEFYKSHLSERHKDKKIYCTYCFAEFGEAQPLADHMLKEHGKRCYQCGMCFYRAFSKPHVQIHIRNVHTTEKAQVHTCSLHLPANYVFPEEPVSTLTTTWPYVCAIGDCGFQTYDPKDFTKHSDQKHRSVSQFFCHYCKGDFISLKRLINHYHLHGINNFQCTYCVHGSETREEILLHLCNCHADKAFKVHVRAPQDADTGNNKTFEITSKTYSLPSARVLPKQVNAQDEKVTKSTEIQRTFSSYPDEVLSLDEDFFCRMVSCNKECKDFISYLNHMKEDHCAINIPCPYCSVVCSDGPDFGNHMTCHGPNLYACSKQGCLWHSFKKDEVVKHMQNAHQLQSDVKTVRENATGEVVPYKVDSEMIQKVDNKSKFYICPFCYYQNTDIKLMKNHIYMELIYKRFQCNLCKEKLCSRSETKGHFSAYHQHHNIKCSVNSNPEIEFLTKCFLTLKIQKRFMEYLKGKKSESGDVLSFSLNYSCEQCNFTFSDIAEWQHHWLYCVSKANQPYVCNHCTDKFGDLAHLKYHTNKEHAGSTINYTLTENVFLKQTTNRKLQVNKLKFFKTLLSPYLKSQNLYGDKLKSFKFESKYYKCGHCNFNDSFRCNIEKHMAGCHKDMSPVVEKIKNDVSVPRSSDIQDGNNSSSTNEAESEVKDVKTDSSEVKPYICGFCTLKTLKLEELEDHVENKHSLSGRDTYPFFYLPDPAWEFSSKDTELYECAYCSVSQENLYHLKRHCNNLHSGVPFKVRGMRSKCAETIQCEYCNLKFMSQELLSKHHLFHHPKLPLKSEGKQKGLKRKEKSDDDIDVPPSKVRKSEDDYVCDHCQQAFPFYIQVVTHHQEAHPNMAVKFTKDSGGSTSKPSDVQLIQCDFCPYLAGQNLMNTHLLMKHKNCFVCAYCGRSFDMADKIVNHVKKVHKGQSVQLVKVDDISPFSEDSKEESLSDSSEASKPVGTLEGYTFYGNKPETVDLHNITVNLHQPSNPQSSDALLPVIYLSQMFPLFPKVYVEDFRRWF